MSKFSTPFTVGRHEDNKDIVVRDSFGNIVANCTCDQSEPDQWVASDHAQLFAAAPELLENIISLVADMEEDQRTGESEGIYEKEPREDIAALKELIKKAGGSI